MHPEFNSLTATAGLEIIDPIETRRFALRTASSVEPTPAATEGFEFPVDTACEVRSESLALSHTVPITIRTRDGDHLETISPTTTTEFSDGAYLVELDAPIKLYLRVDSPMTVAVDTDTAEFEFGRETSVRVGARSYHSSPAGTITVPDDPEATMAAISMLSSALKTTSPERSWPTLRGHPPRIERGDELSIPDDLDAPDTGITVEVPPEYGPIYAVAPLAYYLGAEVVPGESARLITETGFTRSLGDDAAEVGETAGELLKRNLVLDCVTRTEGYYSVELHEREVLEPQVDLDFAELYDASPAERLETYLSIPDEAVESVVPTWHRATHVQPSPDSVEVLPYVVKDLSVVYVEDSGDGTWTVTESERATEEAIGSFVRGHTPTSASADDFVRSAGAEHTRSRAGEGEDDISSRGVPGIGEYVPLPEVDALEQAYVGDKTPERGAKLLPAAFENSAPNLTEGVIEITVVCNDDQMREEWNTVSEIYGDRDDLYVDVDCRFGVSTDELRDLLAEHHDVFHFIGHIDGLGFQCPDGVLDAETVEETGATTLLLNGCRSHDQGIALIEAGASAAVVSLGDVGNEGAVEVGETLARLLYYGFDVGSSMNIVRKYTSIGRDYLVIGDPGVTTAQTEAGMPTVYHITTDANDDSKVDVEMYAHPTKTWGVGSLVESYLPDIDTRFIALGKCGAATLRWEDIRETVDGKIKPLIVDGKLAWSDVWF